MKYIFSILLALGASIFSYGVVIFKLTLTELRQDEYYIDDFPYYQIGMLIGIGIFLFFLSICFFYFKYGKKK